MVRCGGMNVVYPLAVQGVRVWLGLGQIYGSVPISGRTPGLPMVWKGRGDPSLFFGVQCSRFGCLGVRCGRMNVLYLYRGSGQSYGSLPVTVRTWSTRGNQRQGRPILLFLGSSGRFGGFRVQCNRVKVVYFTLDCTGGSGQSYVSVLPVG